MKHFILCCLAGIISACSTQHPIASQHTAPVSATLVNMPDGEPMLLGRGSRTDFNKLPFSTWFEQAYTGYQPDSATIVQLIKQLKTVRANQRITIFLGTWCGDSRREFPRFIKILDSIHWPASQLDIIMVSNSAELYKQSPGHEESGKNIFRVPTFIVSLNGNETGRIIESPVHSLEKDLAGMLNGQPSIPRYAGGQFLFEKIRQQTLEQLIADSAVLTRQLQPLLVHRGELNSIGSVLVAEKQPGKAAFVFDLNRRLFP